MPFCHLSAHLSSPLLVVGFSTCRVLLKALLCLSSVCFVCLSKHEIKDYYQTIAPPHRRLTTTSLLCIFAYCPAHCKSTTLFHELVFVFVQFLGWNINFNRVYQFFAEIELWFDAEFNKWRLSRLHNSPTQEQRRQTRQKAWSQQLVSKGNTSVSHLFFQEPFQLHGFPY